MRHYHFNRTLCPSLLTVCIAVACAGATPMVIATPAVNALPVLNNIASGTASLSTTGNQLTVNQATDKLIANWNSFNVGSAARVQFNQPTMNSIALNRISGSASEFFGRMNANGQLILINPAGITFGSAAQVNAASVIASTLNLSDSNFLADNLLFERLSSGGEINNQGNILANEGNTVVLGASIKNSGTLRARGGNLSLVNGSKVQVNNATGQVSINQISSVASLIQSTGTLRADRLVSNADQGKIFIIADRARNGSVVELAGQLTSLNNDIQGKTINITGDLTANATTSLNAVNAINLNGTFTQNKNNSLLNLTYNPADGLNLGLTSGNEGKITLSGTGMQYQANSASYQVIQTLAQLQALDSNATTRAGKYVLGLDIDASSTASTSFSPIGSSISTPFTGVLDGLGHQIDQISINKPAKDGVGLFGYAQYASLKNLHLSNATVIGKDNVGGLIGYNGNNNGTTGHSWISNSSVSGTMTGYNQLGGLIGSDNVYNLGSSNIVGSSSNSSITGRYTRIGGLTGYANISNGNLNLSGNNSNNIIQASTIVGNKSDIGGIIGRLDLSNQSQALIQANQTGGSVISLSRPAINVSGGIGIVNNSHSTFSMLNNYNHANVSAIYFDYSHDQTVESTHVGGLIGQLNQLDGQAYNLISGNGNDGEIRSVQYIGGLIGYSNGATVSNNHNDGLTEGSRYTGGLIGYSMHNTINKNSNTGNTNIRIIPSSFYPYIGGLIGYAEDSQISENSSSGLTGYGNYISSASYVGGLVGYLKSGSIQNSHATGNTAGTQHVGGLVGYNMGDISYSDASGDVTSLDIYSSTTVLGGLIGTNEGGNISFSHAAGNVTKGVHFTGGLIGLNHNGSVRNSYSSGNVEYGLNKVGGLFGQLLVDSNATSPVEIINNYATGYVNGFNSVGGLIGGVNNSNSTTIIANNYATGNVSEIPHNAFDDLQYIGGLFGHVIANSGVLNISNNYSAGEVTGINNTPSIGGFMGYLSITGSAASTINNNYWNISTAGQPVAIGVINQVNQPIVNLTGLTNTQIIQQSSFVGWDISSQLNGSNSIWYINQGVSSPVLRNLMH